VAPVPEEPPVDDPPLPPVDASSPAGGAVAGLQFAQATKRAAMPILMGVVRFSSIESAGGDALMRARANASVPLSQSFHRGGRSTRTLAKRCTHAIAQRPLVDSRTSWEPGADARGRRVAMQAML
jgi:hypothetical protein